jgi:ABC-type Na+ efflux pump permease subunit
MDVINKSPREQKKALIKGGEMDVKAADKSVERLGKEAAAAKADFDKNAPLPEPKKVPRAGDVYTQDDAAKERDRQGDKRAAAEREKANAVRAVNRAAAQARMTEATRLRDAAITAAATARTKLEAARNWAPPAEGAAPVAPPATPDPMAQRPGESDRDYNHRLMSRGK